MNDNHKTKAELIKELKALRQRVAHLKEAKSKSRHAERGLAVENLRKWTYIFEYSDWGIGIVGAEGKTLVLMNPAFAEIHGYSEEELIGRPDYRYFCSGVPGGSG